ncbi:hypothetical protein K402DRAFT_425881 [Aulographum hederae CBS 113979]|uniref:BTB domain-containing protein n=1 Tax=Aulographum hederae CBS 113979 TaxID=1176131 RepID=A0A6G1GJC5_9PEZI|nr:hypothetical protein K402DRAFT_425881 [Aulographum hederae CBS 113979]
MSATLWKYYIQDDINGFRLLLGQDVSFEDTGGLNFDRDRSGSFGTSPLLTTKHRHPAASKGASATLSRADVNSRDDQGRTLLQVIASTKSESAYAFGCALLDHPYTDVYLQDKENGWTALHRAFYWGNIALATAILRRDVKEVLGPSAHTINAWAGRLMKMKDKEGNGPMDLFPFTVEDFSYQKLFIADGAESASSSVGHSDDETDVAESQQAFEPQGDEGHELFMFGSNSNVTLGFGDEDDRHHPTRLTLRRPEKVMKRIFCPTSETTEHLTTATRNTPIVIKDVRMSKYHTAVITTDPVSNLYMCGHGTGGRLGTGDELSRFQLNCIDGGGLESRQIVSVGLGQDHSLAVDSDGNVFSWGNNSFGQLGYKTESAFPSDLDHQAPRQLVPRQIHGTFKRVPIRGVAASRIHSVAHTRNVLYTWGSNEGQIGVTTSGARGTRLQTAPKDVEVFDVGIEAVSAIDSATVVLLGDHTVKVFTSYGYKIVRFSVSHPLEPQMQNHRRNWLSRDAICSISSGGSTVAALSTTGDIYTFSVRKPTDNPLDPKASTTNPNKIRLGVSDPKAIWIPWKSHMAARDVCVDQDGNIMLSTECGSVWRSTRRTQKSDPSFGPAYSKHKFSRVSGLARIVAVRASTAGAFAAVRRDCDALRKGIEIEIEPTDSLRGLSPIRSFDVSRPEEEIQRKLNDREAQQLFEYDAYISTTCSQVQIPVHTFILCRSIIFRRALAGDPVYKEVYDDILAVSTTENGRPHVFIKDIELAAVFSLVEYLYTNDVVLPNDVATGKKFRSARNDLFLIARKLELGRIEANRPSSELIKSFGSEMESALEDETFFHAADVRIQLADGDLLGHSAILRYRCPYFRDFFTGHSGGQWLSERRKEDTADGLTWVDLREDADVEIFRMVLRHIYADADVDIFDELVLGSLEELVQCALSVMKAADYLHLNKLATACQQVIARYVDERTVCTLLDEISQCAAGTAAFSEAARDYICLNLEALLHHGSLEDLDDDELLELDNVARTKQHDYAMAQSVRAYTCYRSHGFEVDPSTIQYNPPAVRRPSKETRIAKSTDDSPALKERKSHGDLMFELDSDDEDTKASRESKEKRPQSRDVREIHTSPAVESPWLDHRGKHISPPSNSLLAMTPLSPSSFKPSKSFAQSSSLRRSSEGNPWGSSPLQAPKLDLKAIMAQTTAPKSALTEAFNMRRESDGSGMKKLSQKERKLRQQKAQLQMSAVEDPQSMSKSPANPWKTISPKPRTPISPAAPQLTMRQTLAGPSSKQAVAKFATTASTPAAHQMPIRPTPPTSTTKPSPQPTAPAAPTTPSRHPSAAISIHPTTSLPLSTDPTPAQASSTSFLDREPRFSMAEIQYLQAEEKELIKEYKAPRSLQEIQQQQGFEEWFEQESRRVQASLGIGGGEGENANKDERARRDKDRKGRKEKEKDEKGKKEKIGGEERKDKSRAVRGEDRKRRGGKSSGGSGRSASGKGEGASSSAAATGKEKEKGRRDKRGKEMAAAEATAGPSAGSA